MLSMLLESLLSAFNSPITYLVAVLLAVSTTLGVILLKKGRQQRLRIEEINQRLLELSLRYPDGLSPSALKETRDALASDPVLLARWEGFANGLINYRSILHCSVDLESSFSDQGTLEAIELPIGKMTFRFRFLEQLPGLMTGLGMLGTFGGIALGLGEIGGLEGADGGRAVVDSIGNVIVGLASAFWTSIFGLFLALGFSMILSYDEAALTQNLGRFRSLINRLFPRITPEKILRDQHAAALDAQQTQKSLIRLQREQNKLLEEETQHRTEHLLSLQQYQKAEERRRDEEERHRQTEALQLQENLKGGFGALLHAQQQQLTLLERVHTIDAPKPRWGDLIDLQKKQLSVFKVMREESEESRSHLQTIASDLADNLGQQLQSSLENELGPRLERLVDLIDNQVSHTTQASLDSTRHFTAEMVGHLSGAMRDSFKGMSSAVDTFSDKFGETTTQMRSLLQETEQALTQQRDVSRDYLIASREMNTHAQHLLERWTQREEVLLSRYQKASEHFCRAFESGAKIGADLATLSEAFSERHDAIDQLLSITGDLQLQAQEAVTNLDETMQRTSELFERAAKDMGSVSKDTSAWVNLTTGAVEHFGTTLSNTLKDTLVTYDASLSHAVRNLATAINELEEVTYTLVEKGNETPPSSPRLRR